MHISPNSNIGSEASQHAPYQLTQMRIIVGRGVLQLDDAVTPRSVLGACLWHPDVL